MVDIADELDIEARFGEAERLNLRSRGTPDVDVGGSVVEWQGVLPRIDASLRRPSVPSRPSATSARLI